MWGLVFGNKRKSSLNDTPQSLELAEPSSTYIGNSSIIINIETSNPRLCRSPPLESGWPTVHNFIMDGKTLEEVTPFEAKSTKCISDYDKETPYPLMPKLVTRKELASHKSKIDSWVSLFEKVFDVSGYLHKHPGGFSTIEGVLGKDGTDSFKIIHPQVKYWKILGNDFVGIHMPNKSKKLRPILALKSSCPVAMFDICKKKNKPEVSFDLDYLENLSYIVVQASVSCADNLKLNLNSWSVILWNNGNTQFLLIKCFLQTPKVWTAEYELEEELTDDFIYLKFSRNYESMSVLFRKPQEGIWTTLGVPYQETNFKVLNCMKIDDESVCILFYKKKLSAKVILVGVIVRPSTYLGIPLGYSVRLIIDGIHKRYTPVVFSISEKEPNCERVKGQKIFFLMKLSTSDSLLSEIIDDLRLPTHFEDDDEIDLKLYPNQMITIGQVGGSFDSTMLTNVDCVVLLVYDQGIAPMIRIVQKYIEENDDYVSEENHVVLLYFAKNSSDIIWKNEWIDLDERNEWFHAFFIVEEPGADWDQLVGTVSIHLVQWCLDSIIGISGDLRAHGIACGDSDFNSACKRLFSLTTDFFDRTFIFDTYFDM